MNPTCPQNRLKPGSPRLVPSANTNTGNSERTARSNKNASYISQQMKGSSNSQQQMAVHKRTSTRARPICRHS
jgi:hypothetical protein